VVHPERNLIENQDESRHLEPKAMDALKLLVQGDGEVATKDDFIDQVWEGRIISEGTLTNTIAELRSSLGDDARSPQYIETIPKRGYRLICPVEPAPALESPAEESDSARWWSFAAVIVAVVLCVAAVLFLRPRPQPLDPEVVLVSPFANRTGDSALDPLSALARDRIVSQLSGSHTARPVVADSSAVSVTVGELIDLARSEGAGLAMTGAFYLHEGEIEVQAQLVEVAEGALLYAAPSVTGPEDRATESLDEVVQRTLGALATHLRAHAHSSLLSRPPNFEAYREFMVGSELFPVDYRGAVRHLKNAVEIDPGFTSAHFRLANALRNSGRPEEGRAVLDALNHRRAELTEFERLWLDSFIASFEGRTADALNIFSSIRRMAPTDWVVLHLMSSKEMELNRPRRAISILEELFAQEIPDFVARHGLFKFSFLRLARARHILGEHPAELEAVRAGRERFPTDSRLMVAEARALVAMGDLDGLEELFADVMATPTGMTPADVFVGAAATARAHGRPELARILASRAIDFYASSDEVERSPWEQLGLAEALVHLDELDRAQSVLEEIMPLVSDDRGVFPVAVRGWLGVIAARRSDLETARSMDRELTATDDPYLYGLPLYYRAAVAAWFGHREEAVELLQAARAEGWKAFFVLHDEERVLFEPLEGMTEYEAMLHPVE
jgi:DNA-binding winged helix-turn-helix (wHTH) protein/tetratricopeptide (TPR) repeat protein